MLHKPAVLVPLPRSSSRGDQQRNARLFADAGAAAVLDGEEATPERLCAEVRRLLTDRRELERMARAAAGFDAAGSADRIASVIMDEVEWTS
jgi:UDP-N-acetylglucosamine--N-acetylmuramyl-(pentapeptide) pyrophosphoryl-undecaprenol N-acetylglucosamine transferase